jgi:hypothetical protein
MKVNIILNLVKFFLIRVLKMVPTGSKKDFSELLTNEQAS